MTRDLVSGFVAAVIPLLTAAASSPSLEPPSGSAASARLCPPAPAASATDPALSPRGVVAIRTVNGETGRPVAGAVVWPAARPAARSLADERGLLRMEAPTMGGLCAAAPGFVAVEQAMPPPAATGGVTYRFPIVLWPVHLVRGKVVTPDRAPLPGARVHLGFPALAAGSRKRVGAALPVERSTGSGGGFELLWAAVDRITLFVRAPGFATASVEAVASPRGTTDLGEIILAPLVALAGEVRAPDGHPVAGAAVSAVGAGGAAEAMTGAGGKFALSGLRSGDVLSLRVARRGFAPADLSHLVVPRAQPLVIDLRRARSLGGQVVDDDGDPVPGARVVALELAKRGEIGSLPELGRLAGQATAGDAGRFALEGLASGRFRLIASARGYLSADQEIDLLEGDAVDDLALTLRRGAIVEGHVLTAQGDPAAGARVRVVDGDERTMGSEAPEAVANEDGAYRLSGVAPGTRTLRAEWSGAPAAVESLPVGSGSNHLDLTLRSGFEVAGRVVTSAGEPVAGARLDLVPADLVGGTLPPQTSGEDGTFSWNAVASGHYRLRAEKSGYGGAPLELVLDGPVLGLEPRLDAGGAIAGRIAGLSAQEMSFVEVRASSPDRGDGVAAPGADGAYRIDGLGPGPWTVVAQVAGGSRAARGGAVVPAGGEAVLDLSFGAGTTLAGTVIHGGMPVAGAWVTVWSGRGSAAAATGADGRFRIEGLAPGPCEVAAVHPGSGLERDLRIDLETDADLTLELPDAPAGDRSAKSAAPF